MPQHLKICVEDTLVGQLSTGNKGGTRYRVRLLVTELAMDPSPTVVDTGVQCQPQDQEEKRADFKNDFTHARRCIAGLVSSSEHFLQQLERDRAADQVESRPITMRLLTNMFGRGIISVNPVDDQSVDVNVRIGAGGCRVPDALPRTECQLSWEGVQTSGSRSQTARALKVLRSIGPNLLRELSDRAT